jgi:L-cysteine desulfidase
MNLSKKEYKGYINILKSELKSAMGCTEPIAIAYVSAKAREVLAEIPESITVKCSSNIIKNASGVTVPNSGGLKGIKAAAVLGALGGQADKELEVLTDIEDEVINKTKDLVNKSYCKVELLDSQVNLHIIVELNYKNQTAEVELMNNHSNIVRISKDNNLLLEKEIKSEKYNKINKVKESLSISKILEFANQIDIEEVKDIIENQIESNIKIADEGLVNDYGLNVGSTILNSESDSLKSMLKAYTAAGSDARMNGSLLAVVINSGSGNQGLTVSVPVIKFAEYFDIKREKLIRALVLSNLISIHIKNKIGILSAYCGAVSAAAASGAAFSYLKDGTYKEISDTITNTLGNISGIICDGAKASCAAKIASSVDAAILAHDLVMNNQKMSSDEGIVKKDIEDTIKAVGHIGSIGMKKTDEEILKIMI